MIISSDTYGKFQKILHEKTGILLGDNKQYLVSSRLSGFIKEKNIDTFERLLDEVSRPNGMTILQQVIDRMTTNETLWFRDSFPFKFLISHILPELKSNGKNNINIWSAACSSGQEAYSIIMSIEEHLRTSMRQPIPDSIEILGTDISTRMLAQARQGEYQSLEIARGLSEEMKSRYFETEDGRTFKINPELKKRVRFTSLNLMQLPYRSVGKFDIIYCRNVLIYFSGELKENVINGLADCMHPGGYLFLGASESMPSSIKRFKMIRCNPGLAYQLI
ncbi:CheR family methyltransferase [Pleionea sediminis]|uniref:CheR family methyltransferase n=1 Tax=Pleionea sediminis TaxID=2569479 RepID=UPI0011857613|nr:protein-glutamate O-methyltransferase CheR [Pleionea sediminis]